MSATRTDVLSHAVHRLVPERGFPVFRLARGSQSAGVFRRCLEKACHAYGPLASCVTVHGTEEYASRDLYLDADGSCGFALKDGEVASVFRHPARPGPVLPVLMRAAVEAGADRLDAYDTVLPSLYKDCGFTAVARLPWDDRSAQPGWSHAAFQAFNGGRPDVVFMVYGLPTLVPLQVATYEEGLAGQQVALAVFRSFQAGAYGAPLLHAGGG